MQTIETPVKIDDWVRFQLHREHDNRVLEGYVQQLSEDGRFLRVGKEPHGPEWEWLSFAEISILKTQSPGVLI